MDTPPRLNSDVISRWCWVVKSSVFWDVSEEGR